MFLLTTLEGDSLYLFIAAIIELIKSSGIPKALMSTSGMETR